MKGYFAIGKEKSDKKKGPKKSKMAIFLIISFIVVLRGCRRKAVEKVLSYHAGAANRLGTKGLRLNARALDLS